MRSDPDGRFPPDMSDSRLFILECRNCQLCPEPRFRTSPISTADSITPTTAPLRGTAALPGINAASVQLAEHTYAASVQLAEHTFEAHGSKASVRFASVDVPETGSGE